MVETIAEMVLGVMRMILPKMKTVDIGWGWEDIAFRSGPLISPEILREVALPSYRKISDLLLEYGCDLNATDSDGLIDELIPVWLEGGVNVMFPLEIGAWKADPAELRKKYGRDLRIYGGIDKLELAKGRKAIDAEIERRLPLMKEGGFVPFPDHLLIPGQSLSDYQYYVKRIRELRF